MSEPEIDPGREKPADAQASEIGHQERSYDAAAERRVRHKLDYHMMPLFFILCKLYTTTPPQRLGKTLIP